jgi:hypothetical protein
LIKKYWFLIETNTESTYRGTHLITEVKQHWARLVLGWVTAQMTSMLDAIRKYTRILWPCMQGVGEATERSYSACQRKKIAKRQKKKKV